MDKDEAWTETARLIKGLQHAKAATEAAAVVMARATKAYDAARHEESRWRQTYNTHCENMARHLAK